MIPKYSFQSVPHIQTLRNFVKKPPNACISQSKPSFNALLAYNEGSFFWRNCPPKGFTFLHSVLLRVDSTSTPGKPAGEIPLRKKLAINSCGVALDRYVRSHMYVPEYKSLVSFAFSMPAGEENLGQRTKLAIAVA
jgi:hypothetical protein